MLDWASMRNRPDAREIDRVSSFDGAPEAAEAGKEIRHFPGAWAAARRAAGRISACCRALDEAGIDVNMIAGTSIGALVGGCYLAGKLDQLEEFARSLTKRRMFGLLDLHIGGNGLFGGMKLTQRMQEHMSGLTFADLGQAVRLRRRRNPHRPRDLAVERLADHRHARLLCAARRVRAGHLQWPRPGRRRAGQSGAGLGLPRLRAAAGRRRQPALRPLRPRRGDQAQRRRTGHRTGRNARPADPIRAVARDPARHHRRHGRGLQHHPGSHLAGPPRRRSARHVAAAEARSHRPVRVPPRRRSDPDRLRDHQGPRSPT